MIEEKAVKKVFLLVFFLLSSTSALSLEITGSWQPSYAFNGKIPWYNGTLIVEATSIKFQTKGIVSESWKILDSDRPLNTNYLDVLVSNDEQISIFRFEINEKYQCSKKSKFSYDKNCTNHDKKSPFRLLICSSSKLNETDFDSCKVRDRYFDFHSNQIEQLETGKYL